MPRPRRLSNMPPQPVADAFDTVSGLTWFSLLNSLIEGTVSPSFKSRSIIEQQILSLICKQIGVDSLQRMLPLYCVGVL